MTLDQFQAEMERLSRRFDPKYYDSQLCAVIFRECEALSHYWLNKTVTLFLGGHKPPLLTEFRDAIRIEKTNASYSTRPTERRESASMFTQAQINFLFKVLHLAGRGSFPDHEEFCQILTRVIENKDQRGAAALFKEVSETYGIELEA
jgi:hypothetical protein